MSEPGGLTRRGITRATVAGSAAAAALRPRAVAAATTYTPASYTKTRRPGVSERHLANRFAYCWTPALGKQVVAAGGPTGWFDEQLALTGVDDGFHDTSATWWRAINLTPAQLMARHESGVQPMWQALNDYQRWVLVRRVASKRQVLEVMTDFWENHFHVPITGAPDELFRIEYGKGIRARALGRFEDLLRFAITSPAMGLSRNNAVSTAKAPNEDLGRELLELHTVGRGHYTEKDVLNSARLLTGWRVDAWDTWEVFYDPLSHWLGLITVMGFTDTNLLPDGRDLTRRYLRYLAHHPATARRIATKLAIRFVADDPPAALVDKLTAVYLANDTAIRPVLRALVASPEFASSAGAKVRTPEDDVVASYRVLGVKIGAPTTTKSAANQILWQCQHVGLAPLKWVRPDGRPDQAWAWASTSRMLNSFKVHRGLSGGWHPSVDVRYRTPASWLPQDRIRFDALVDHLARRLTGRHSTATLLRACAEATECTPREVITRDHRLVKWRMPRLLTTLLDHPAHMTR